MHRVLVIHGPNLNLLGSREPDVYGSETLDAINARLTQQAAGLGIELQTFQSNSEGALVDRIHQGGAEDASFVLINPGAYTHTSVALRDALLGTGIPFIEIHISNVHAREEFRQMSYLSDVAVGVISGLGSQGYDLALAAAARHLKDNEG